MDFQSLPTDANSILALKWQDYEPFFRDLETRALQPEDIQTWLDDWSKLAATVDEQYWRLYIATTVDTADKESEERFNQYLEEIQPVAKTAEQTLKDKLLASRLSPKGFETALRMMQAEAEIFTEENLPLLAEEQKLGTEYNKIIGSLTVPWEGEERTFPQMFPLLYEADRSVRQRAWEAAQTQLLKERQNINSLWEKFMPVRLKLAENAGLPDYRAYIWKQRFRFDYSPEDCYSFHAAIEASIVPAAKRVYEKRRQRLGVDTLRPWDINVDPLGTTPIDPYESIAEFKSRSRAVLSRSIPNSVNTSRL